MRSLSRVTRLGLIGGTLLAAACSRPDFQTDLNEEGPPQVTLVAVASESSGEAATFCGSVLRNELYCDGDIAVQAEKVTDAVPMGVGVRIAFDELLDPSIELLVDEDGNPVTDANEDEAVAGSIVDANPVTVDCGDGALAYIGHYEPSGNIFTMPAGPALVVTVTDPVATGAACTVAINDSVKDKDGEAVAADEKGPYNFDIAPLAVTGTSPADAADGIVPTAETILTIDFNNYMDEASLAGKLSLTDGDGTDVPFTAAVDASSVTMTPTAGWAENTTYTVAVAAAVADVKGGALAEGISFSFTTGTVPAE